jgi:hypothetical protein
MGNHRRRVIHGECARRYSLTSALLSLLEWMFNERKSSEDTTA